MKKPDLTKTILLFSLCIFMQPIPVHADVRVWDGGSSLGSDWNTSFFGFLQGYNWNPNENPVAGDDLVFTGTTQLENNNNYAAGTEFSSITFSNAGAFVIGGNSITLGAGGIVNKDNDTQTLNLDLQLEDSRTVNAENGDIVINGEISGEGGLTKTGDYELTLTALNSYEGDTTINGGTLNLTEGSSTGAGQVIIGAGGRLTGTGLVNGPASTSGIHTPGGDGVGLMDFSSDLSYEDGAQIMLDIFANSSSGRGTNFDAINVDGNLSFEGSTTIELSFNQTDSTVNWSDDFWSTDQSLLIFEVSGTLTSPDNLSILSEDWIDAFGQTLGEERSDAFFSMRNDVDGNIYLDYSVPEPAAASLVLLFGISMLSIRRILGK